MRVHCYNKEPALFKLDLKLKNDACNWPLDRHGTPADLNRNLYFSCDVGRLGEEDMNTHTKSLATLKTSRNYTIIYSWLYNYEARGFS